MRNEADFIEAIDCRFPYGDAALAESLIDEACSISGNAAFMVAHELARRPESSSASDAVCMALLDRLDERLTHPLKDSVLAVARRMVRREPVRFDECKALLSRIAAYPGEFNALAIVCFSCEDAEAVDHICDAIVEGWRRSDQAQQRQAPRGAGGSSQRR